MSDTAVDSIRLVDKDMGSGLIFVHLVAQVHLRIPSGNVGLLNDLEDAAKVSQSAFDAVVAGASVIPSASRTFYASLPSDQQNAIREAAIRR